MDSSDEALDNALLVIAGCVLIWLALSGATVGLLAALAAFGAAHLVLRS